MRLKRGVLTGYLIGYHDFVTLGAVPEEEETPSGSSSGSLGLLAAAAGVAALAGLAVYLIPSQPKLVLKEVGAAESPAADAYATAAKPDHRRPERNPAEALEEKAAGQAPINLDHYKTLEWRVLRGLDTKTGEASAGVKAVEGGSIKISGYMVPFDDDQERVTQFLLVPVAGMCIHLPPPPANQIILVEMANGEAKLVDWNRQVNVYGLLEISASQSPYGAVSYKIAAQAARADSSAAN